MAIESIASVKGHFETGDVPTQTEFANLIDTLGRATPLAIASAAEGGKTGVYEVLGDGDVTARSTGTVGLQILSVAGTTSARDALGISSVASIFLDAASTASSQSLLGITSTGVTVIEASGASALALVLPSASTSLPGVVEVATSAEVSAQTSGKFADAAGMGSHPGMAKAWVSFVGSASPSVRGSFNVTTVSANATGDYTVHFTTSFAGTEYVCVGMAGNGDTTSNGFSFDLSTRAAGTQRLLVRQISPADVLHPEFVDLVFYGPQ